MASLNELESRGLAFGAAVVIALTVAMALAFALLLAFLKFDQKLLDVSVARLALVVQEVRQQSETGLALGLELEELEDLGTSLRRAAAARDVVHIDIVDGHGTVLHSTDDDRPGLDASHTPGFPADAMRSGAQALQVHQQGNELLLYGPLVDGFGHVVGVVVVHSSMESLRASLNQVARELLLVAIPVLAVALLVTLGMVVLTLRLTMRQFLREQTETSASVGPDAA